MADRTPEELQAAIKQAAEEFDPILNKHNLALASQAFLTNDGRISSRVILVPNHADDTANTEKGA